MTDANDELESITKTLFGCSAAGCLIIIATACAIVLIFLVGALIFGACQQDEWASPDLGRNEVVVTETLRDHALSHALHLRNGIGVAVIEPPLEFRNVRRQVLYAHLSAGPPTNPARTPATFPLAASTVPLPDLIAYVCPRDPLLPRWMRPVPRSELSNNSPTIGVVTGSTSSVGRSARHR